MGRLAYTLERGVEWVPRPTAAEAHAQEVSLRFAKEPQTKIGVVLHRSRGFVKVHHVQPGSLADGALRVDDILLSVNGEVSRADLSRHMARLILAADDVKLELLRRSSSELSEISSSEISETISSKPAALGPGAVIVPACEAHASPVVAAATAEPDEVCEVEAFEEIKADAPSTEVQNSPGCVLSSPDWRALAEVNMAPLIELRESDRTAARPGGVEHERLVLDDFQDDDEISCFET
eukprot:3666329-Prymnesium_polylepis.1